MTEFLLEEGREVVGIDDLNDAYDVRLKEYRLSRLEGRRGSAFARVDITDRRALAAAWNMVPGPFAAVVNLAARAASGTASRTRGSTWTPTSTALNLLDLCRRRGTAKFVLASTSSLYGGHNPLPYAEDADTSRLLTQSASKQGSEALCFAYHHLHGLNITVFRYSRVLGPPVART